MGGRPKGAIEFGGATLALRAAGLLWPLCGSVLVSLAEGDSNPAPGYPIVVDPPPPGCGPLAGIQAAFGATGDADLLVLACDYPLVSPALVGRLAAQSGGTENLIMMTDLAGRDHPLVALWRREAEPVVRSALERKRFKVRALLADLSVRRLGPADFPEIDLDRALFNVNEPEQLALLEGGG